MKLGESFQSILDRHKGVGPGFDLLRIGLALVIFWGHAKAISAGHALAHINQAASLHAGNWEGFRRPLQVAYVPMFFALSGFLVTGSALRLRSVGTFLAFRGFRIFPALLVEVTLSAVLLGAAFTTLPLSQYFSSAEFFRYFGNIVGQITFVLPGVFKHNPWPETVNANLWTLPAEFDCYLISAMLMAIGVMYNRAVVTGFFVVATIIMLGLNTFTNFAVTPMMMDPIAVTYYFFVGVIFFHWRDQIPFNIWLFVSAAALCYPLLYWHHTVFIAPILLTYVTLFIGMIKFPTVPFISSGDYSYGVYLYGFPITQGLVALFPWFHGRGWATLFVAAVCTFAFAAVSWHVIEKPALAQRKLLKRIFAGSANPVIPEPPIRDRQ
jgi:peptidoglycan/LPS O-acetylase OafA/YrhL